MQNQSLQEKFAKNSICYGCGPANNKGLHIRSFAEGDQVVCDWTPEPHHEAFPGVLNGGIIGTLLDCHSNWTAAWHLMQQNNWPKPMCTVTAKYAVELLKPTPSKAPLRLVASVIESKADRATVKASLYSGDKECARCVGTFVAVKENHPAYHRWE